MKYIASVSFGKDSLAMILKLLELGYRLDEVIFYDTGMEFESIYRNKDKLKKVLDSRSIKFTVVKPKESFLYTMLIRPVRNAKGIHYGYEWCGGNTRWGTRNKISAIKKHFKQAYGNEEVYEYIGIAADEQDRMKDDKHKLYPLIEWNMTERDCLMYCYEQGYDWNENGVELYSVLDRVSCWCCQNKNLKELKNIYLYLPEYWERLKGIQSRVARPMKGKKTVFDLEERFKKEVNK